MPLPKIEDWKAPWEKNEGDEIDAEKAKVFTYSLLQREEKALNEAASAKKALETVQAEKDALQKTIDDKAREGESESDRMKREIAELQKRLDEKPKGDDIETIRLRVALDKGLTLSQAKRLVGTTEEEILADVEELLKDLAPKNDKEKDDDDDDDTPVRRTPRRVSNPLDPDDRAPKFDVDKAVDLIPRP